MLTGASEPGQSGPVGKETAPANCPGLRILHTDPRDDPLGCRSCHPGHERDEGDTPRLSAANSATQGQEFASQHMVHNV